MQLPQMQDRCWETDRRRCKCFYPALVAVERNPLQIWPAKKLSIDELQMMYNFGSKLPPASISYQARVHTWRPPKGSPGKSSFNVRILLIVCSKYCSISALTIEISSMIHTFAQRHFCRLRRSHIFLKSDLLRGMPIPVALCIVDPPMGIADHPTTQYIWEVQTHFFGNPLPNLSILHHFRSRSVSLSSKLGRKKMRLQRIGLTKMLINPKPHRQCLLAPW